MTPAEELTAAADKLDALASGATEGPWLVSCWEDFSGRNVNWILEGIERFRDMKNDVNLVEDEGTARYIAAMNPLVGKALAAVMRTLATGYEREIRHFHAMWNDAARERMVGDKWPGFREALALARLINGSES